MKKFIFVLFLLIGLFFVYQYREDIVIFMHDNFINTSDELNLDFQSEYYRDYNLSYVNTIDTLKINSKEELVDLYYTVINKGATEFKFHCSREYKNCINDVVYLSEEQTTLSNINNFIHPYNRFSSIKTTYDSLRYVTIELEKTYSKEQQEEINKVIDKIIKDEIKDEKDHKKMIRIFHDYIINNTKYDKERADNNIMKYQSHTAYGVLLEHFGLCGGYADALAIFLDRYNIPNFRVVSENHIWNAVYLDNTWYHLDATWDDPILTNGKDTLEYTFFMITTSELEELETNQHIFNKKVFAELDY